MSNVPNSDEKIKKDKLTAGDKCAFANMIFAKTEKGWTPATKMLAVTYIDLSEKHGYAFAGQWYLEFRTGLSKRTMNRSNNTIQESGLFELRYMADDSLEVVPNLERIRAEYEKYQEEERRVRQERQDKMALAPRQNVAGPPDKMAPGPRQNGAHNLSMESLYPNPSISIIPERSAPGVSARSKDGSASGADRLDVNGKKPVKYRQTSEVADRTFEEIKRAWPEPSVDAEHQPGHDSYKAASFHYYGLLKSGIGAGRIKKAALHFLEIKKQNQQWSRSLASFLTGHLHDYLDPDQPDLYIPDEGDSQSFETESRDKRQPVSAKPVQPPAAGNDNNEHAPQRAVGQDWEPCDHDAPF